LNSGKPEGATPEDPSSPLFFDLWQQIPGGNASIDRCLIFCGDWTRVTVRPGLMLRRGEAMFARRPVLLRVFATTGILQDIPG